jgi:hypothetical protein
MSDMPCDSAFEDPNRIILKGTRAPLPDLIYSLDPALAPWIKNLARARRYCEVPLIERVIYPAPERPSLRELIGRLNHTGFPCDSEPKS